MTGCFDKYDLRTGVIVVTKNGGNAILMGNRFLKSHNLINFGGMSDLKSYRVDLTNKHNADYDIEKVYRILDAYDYTLQQIIDTIPKEKLQLIWQRKKEIDWSKVPKFTKVQVRNSDNDKWRNRRFIKYSEENTLQYVTTVCDEFTFNQSLSTPVSWKQIRMYDDSEIKEEWYK